MGQPEEIAAAVLWLAPTKQRSRSVTPWSSTAARPPEPRPRANHSCRSPEAASTHRKARRLVHRRRLHRCRRRARRQLNVRAAAVHFTPARAPPGTPPHGQTIFITRGGGVVPARGRRGRDHPPGDRVAFEPGENHSHGPGPEPVHGPHRAPVSAAEPSLALQPRHRSGNRSEESGQWTHAPSPRPRRRCRSLQVSGAAKKRAGMGVAEAATLPQ